MAGYDCGRRGAAPHRLLLAGGKKSRLPEWPPTCSKAACEAWSWPPPAGDFATWRVIVMCQGCCACRTHIVRCHGGPARVLPMSSSPPGVAIMRLLDRMRCAVCSKGVERAALDNGAPGWRRRTLLI